MILTLCSQEVIYIRNIMLSIQGHRVLYEIQPIIVCTARSLRHGLPEQSGFFPYLRNSSADTDKVASARGMRVAV